MEPRQQNGRPLRFSELVDLEFRLLEDRDADPGALRARDAAIAGRIGAADEQLSRHALFRRWLEAVRDGDEPTPGERIHAHYRLAGLLLATLAALTGSGTAAALLRYDGRDPVNLIGFLAVFVGLQLGLVLLSLVFMLPARWLGRLTALSGLQLLVRQLGYRRSGIERLLAAVRPRRAAAASLVGRARALHAVYADVERWMLMALTQRAAVCFNLGALATCAYLIAVSALAFAWSTTLTIGSDAMARALQTLALPWGWLLPSAVPSRELVAASRYFPGGRYDPDLLGDWWPFLIAALCCYGLLPRVALAAFAGRRARALRARLRLDHGDCEVLYERLTRGRRGFERADAASAAAGERGASGAPPAAPLPDAHASCVALCWGDAPLGAEDAAALIAGRFGWRVESFHAVVGSGDADERELLEQLAARGGRGPVVLLAEAWEAPARSLKRFLSALRERIGGQRALVVALVAGAPQEEAGDAERDVAIWRRWAAALADPYLRVEAL